MGRCEQPINRRPVKDRGLARAVHAASPEQHLMSGEFEPRGQHGAELAWACSDIEHAITLLAAEVMVVCGGDSSGLVAVGLAVDHHGHDRSIGEHSADNSVHRSNTERRDLG